MKNKNIDTHILEKINQGLIVLDKQYQLIYLSNWLIKRCPILSSIQSDKETFFSIFPELEKSRVHDAIDSALSHGMPSIISNVFVKSPFPIFQLASKPGAKVVITDKKIAQAIQIMPLELFENEKYCLITIDDITPTFQREDFLKQQVAERKKAELELKQEQELFEAGPSVIFKLKNDEKYSIVYVSPNVKNQFSYDVKELKKNTSFIDLIYADDLEMYKESIENNIKQQQHHFELSYRIKNATGHIRWVNDYISTITDSRGNIEFLHGYLVDVTEKKEAQEQIKQQAYYDALTNLPNRRMLMDRLVRELARSSRKKFYCAMAYLDLDKFKYINDSLGHAIGDDLLVEVARRVETHIRGDDMVARMGGDEFVILLSDLNNDKNIAGERASLIIEKIREKLSAPYFIKDNELHTSPSIGVYIFSGQHGKTADAVIQHADTAMYKAKESGRNTVRFYTDEMQYIANNRIQLEKNLRLSVENNEMRLLFQPQISRNNEVIACEALVRWEKNGQIISPLDFIPVAEETGIIIDIGEWVLHEACRCFKMWQKQYQHLSNFKMQHIAVNVSPRQFRDSDFVKVVQHVLKEFDMHPNELELEITEGIVIANVEKTIEKMQQLKSIGVRLAMDDFGTGYSSLSYLKKLPLDILKIDQSFIRDAHSNVHDKTIVSTIIAMAQKMSMVTVAEGIENIEILEFLANEGCNVYQGYYFSKPIDSQSFADFLIQWQGNKTNNKIFLS